MNAKKAKALRRFLRKTGLDPTDARYVWKVRSDKKARWAVLQSESGRGVYVKLKPLWA